MIPDRNTINITERTAVKFRNSARIKLNMVVQVMNDD
jgi:hypothetical protein